MEHVSEYISLGGEERQSADQLDLDNCETLAQIEQQHRHVPGKQSLSLLAPHYLQVDRKRFKKQINALIDLEFVDPKPVPDFYTPWVLIACTSLLVLFGAALVYAIANKLLAGTPTLLIITGTSFLLALASGIWATRRLKRRFIFISRHGRVPLFKVIVNQPFKDSYQLFYEQLESVLVKCAHKEHDDMSEFIAHEMRDHRRLKEVGLLDEPTYELAKQRIMRVIG